MIDHDDLEQSSGVGVTSTIVVIVTIITLSNIRNHVMNFNYPEAQKFLVPVFLFPVLITWQAWVDIFFGGTHREVDLVVNILKAVCLTSLYLHIEKMLGKVEKNGKIVFSDEKVHQVLCSDKYFPEYCCIKSSYITTTEQAKKYLFKLKIFVFQIFFVVFIITGIGAWVLIDEDLALDTDSVFIILQIIRFSSIVVLLFTLTTFCNYIGKLPDLDKYKFSLKVRIVRVLIIFAELQWDVLKVFAAAGLIANTDKYSTADIVSYTYSLIIGSEMIIIAVFMSYNFQIYDFYDSFDLKSKIPLIKEVSNT